MTAEVQSPSASTGAKALLSYLRDHPNGREEGSRVLAQRFGISQDFVERVLERAEPISRPASAQTQHFTHGYYEFKKQVRGWRDDAAKHPTTFVIATTVAAEFVLLLVGLSSGHSAVDLNIQKVQFNPFGASVWVPLIAILSQLALYYRKAKARFAFFGAISFFFVGGVPLGLLSWTSLIGQDVNTRLVQCLFIVLAHLLVSVVYGVAGATLSFLGEYRLVLKENKRVETMTRQELLERLFQLEARMELARNDPEKMVRFKKLTTFFRGRLLVSAFIAGALLGLPSSFTISPHLANIHLLQPESLPSVVGVTFSACVGLLSLAAVGWLAYLAPNIVTALFVGFLYAFGQIGTHLLLGPQARDVHSVILRFYLIYSAISPLVALLAGVGAAIQTRTLEELNIQRNDEASLIAEQLKIQWRLAEHSCSVTVVVVDVVKSTLMKEGEPGLQVEYSFRKFQQWIEEIALSHSGTVTSTAGDGAVFSFTSCHNAMIAAAEIQRKMPAFNQTWNRLATRFRVRIGLHMGEVQGDINKVQFAQVIDVAAHVQKVAPAGGVAVTAEVVATLGPSAFVPLAVKSDGHDVFLALNPSGL